MSGPRLEKTRRGKTVLRSGCCSLPHAEVIGSKLRITSHHDRERHAIELTPQDLRDLAEQLEKEGGTTWRLVA